MLLRQKYVLLFGLVCLLVGTANLSIAQKKKQVTLEDIWVDFKFYAMPAKDIRWMKDDRYYSEFSPANGLQKKSVTGSEEATTLVAPDALFTPEGKKLKVDGYAFSGDEQKVLFKSETENIYRHSASFKCYVYDIQEKKLQSLFDAKRIQIPTFSPDGANIAYVHENNLFITDLKTGQTKKVTQDGLKNHIINGTTDWVYEEEFGFIQGFHWAPDGRRIAFYRFDESDVPEYTMATYGTLYPEQNKFKYPKAGEKNAIIEIKIYDLLSGQTLNVDIGTEKDIYIPRIKWTQSPERLAVMRMNRLQNKVEVLIADSRTGGTKVILTENSDTYIEQPGDNTWTFLEKKDEFLWLSERDGYQHLYHYDFNGKLIRQLTAGEWEITSLYGLDEKNGVVYYQSTEVSPLERHIYSIKLDGTGKKQISQASGWTNASFSSGYSYYIGSYNAPDIPTQTILYNRNGEVVRQLQMNERVVNNRAEYEFAPREYFSFTTTEGIQLNGWMIKPLNFKKNKKHPVLMFVYGGPGSQEVEKNYDGTNYYWYQLLAQNGYIVACVDNRGTGGRGAKFKKATYNNLGKYETIDQIEAAKYLGGLPYVDKTRIGIWGWSFGGYMSTLCLTKGAQYFKAAIAVAPVTNWRYYDTIYTERYLQTPQLNASGYDDNSPINFADQMKGNYLLIHGTADDNVHYQNAIEMSTALIKNNVQFEMFYYPDKNHGIYGGNTRYHLYKLMTRFVLEKL